nr:MAG TPA: hypothetical protein [Bacteriophage sp.]DAQ14556.1 MAG TPA: hypothetical protein [Bacteriophage sp.]DAX94338.1 MAG TPA: hypothetical protein [Bacteriophage sp.]
MVFLIANKSNKRTWFCQNNQNNKIIIPKALFLPEKDHK